MKRRRILFAASIVVLVVSTFLVVMHQHENTVADHDCPVCAVHPQPACCPTIASHGAPLCIESICPLSEPAFGQGLVIASILKDRAPPARQDS